MDEHILAPVSRDEAKPLRIVEPLYGSGLTTHLRDSRKGPGNPSTGKLFREIYSFLGEPIDVHLDPDRDSKIAQFFYHLIKARQLAQQIPFSQYGPESETKVGIFFNRLAESRKFMHGLCEQVGPRFLANLKDVRRLTRELAPLALIKNGR